MPSEEYTVEKFVAVAAISGVMLVAGGVAALAGYAAVAHAAALLGIALVALVTLALPPPGKFR